MRKESLNTVRETLRSAGLVLVVGLGLWVAPAQAAFIEMRGPGTVVEGNPVAIEVWADGLEDEFIGGYDLTVLFDPTLVSFLGVDFGSGLDGPDDSFTDVVPDIGSVNLFEVSLSGLFNQDGSSAFRLFTLNFDALMVGIAGFSFGDALVSDGLGGELQLSSLFGTQLEIQPVPEPGTLGLLGLGLAGLAAARRRRQLPSA